MDEIEIKKDLVKKYELYTLTDLNGNKWNVMEVLESMADDEIDTVCRKYGIDEVTLSIQRKETTLRTIEAPEEFYIPARKKARPKQELKTLAFMGPRSNGA